MVSRSLQRYQSIKTRFDASAAVDDAAFLTEVNALSEVAPVDRVTVVKLLLEQDTYNGILDSIAASARNFVSRLTLVADGLSPLTIDFTVATVVRDIDGMIGSELTRGQADALIALGANKRSQADVDGQGIIKQRDLGRMRIEALKGLIT